MENVIFCAVEVTISSTKKHVKIAKQLHAFKVGLLPSKLQKTTFCLFQ